MRQGLGARLLGLLAAVLLCVSLFPAPALADEYDPLYPEYLSEGHLSATSALLIEADSGKVVFEKNADQRMYPASTTKILTVWLALVMGESLEEKMETKFPVSANAANLAPDVNGGRSGGGEYDTINPWLVVLVYQDWYQELVRKTWTEAYERGVFSRCCEMIETDSALLRDEFELNYARWDNIRSRSEFDAELSEPARRCTTEAEAAAFLQQWLSSRVEFLNSQWHT